MSEQNPPGGPQEPSRGGSSRSREISYTILSWVGTILLVGSMVGVFFYVRPLMARSASNSPAEAVRPTSAPAGSQSSGEVLLPEWKVQPPQDIVVRLTNPRTIAPTRPRSEVQKYTIDQGDSIFGIAKKYNISPESVLWANYDTLNDNPDMIAPGLVLNIPPANGVYYQWQDGDTLNQVADRFKAKADDILAWVGNKLDIAQPVVGAGTYIFIPNGKREFKQWVVPTIPRGKAGVLKTILGPGACDTGDGGAMGSGHFIWPSANHYLSGNDYWSGHLGIDIAAGMGAGISAADSGLVVYSGWSNGGYGNMVMIDHGNGYQTLYAHLSSLSVHCGQSVGQGQGLGLAGSTGNSTGAHLHFEIRYLGGFVNPWSLLQ